MVQNKLMDTTSTLCLGLLILNGEATAIIPVNIVSDDIPEIDEQFGLQLESVRLATDINGGRDFSFAGDTTQIDSVPQLGPNTATQVVIAKNDDANGVIMLVATQLTVQEGSIAMIQLLRSRGTFGTVAVSFSITPGSALGSGIDYSAPSSPITIPSGVSSAVIAIPIVDDAVAEFQESFTVALSTVGGGARLDGPTSALVIIDSSDNPTGRVRFTSTTPHTVDNPVTAASETFIVERLDGTSGTVQVRYTIVI